MSKDIPQKSLVSKRKYWKENQRKWRAEHPERSVYNNLRTNAKRRGKEFTLTFDQFLASINGTQYMEMKGRAADSLTIDRIDHTNGYVNGNIAVITNSDNATKGNQEKKEKPQYPEDPPF